MRSLGRLWALCAVAPLLGVSASPLHMPTQGVAARVQIVLVPQHGKLADAKLDAAGHLHLVYVAGNDLYYTTSAAPGAAFAPAVRVNDRAGFVAGALFRGPKLALTADGSAHIVWYNRAYDLGLDRSQYGVMYSAVRPGAVPAPAQYLLRGGADGYSVASDGATVLAGWHDDKGVAVARRTDRSGFQEPRVLESIPCECCDTACSRRR